MTFFFFQWKNKVMKVNNTMIQSWILLHYLLINPQLQDMSHRLKVDDKYIFFLCTLLSLSLFLLFFSYPFGLVDRTLFVCLCMRMDVTTFIVSFFFLSLQNITLRLSFSSSSFDYHIEYYLHGKQFCLTIQEKRKRKPNKQCTITNNKF